LAQDVIAPIIRDLGLELAMSPGRATAEMIRMVMSAQMGRAGPPMDRRCTSAHSIAASCRRRRRSGPALTLTGMAWPSRSRATDASRFRSSATAASLGEWHEAINMCAVRQLPAVFCVQNNQTALSTPLGDQTAVRVFADKAIGYGIPGITIDGTDRRDRRSVCVGGGRARRKGPSIVGLISMRMCGHAHHDDMLYLGKDRSRRGAYPSLTEAGYANGALRIWRGATRSSPRRGWRRKG
jgi:TPP-dependent pyruvate/acetoin dehydrogenase alpha subunit